MMNEGIVARLNIRAKGTFKLEATVVSLEELKQTTELIYQAHMLLFAEVAQTLAPSMPKLSPQQGQ